jgi:hypothetical protein
VGVPVLDRGQRCCSGCAGAVVAAFFVALTVAFWKRSWPWGVVVLNAGTLLKVTWSVAFGGEAGWASLAPSIFTLVVTDAAILLAVGL